MICCVFGATGAVGREVVKAALDRKHLFSSVIAVVRKKPNLETIWGSKSVEKDTTLKVIEFDFSAVSVVSRIQQEILTPALYPDVIYYCLGTTLQAAGSRENFRRVDLGYLTSLCVALRRNYPTKHLKRFDLLSAANSSGVTPLWLHPYPRTKYDCECVVLGIGNMGTDSTQDAGKPLRPVADSVAIWQPPLIKRGKQARWGERIAAAIPYFPAVTAEDLGLAMVKRTHYELVVMKELPVPCQYLDRKDIAKTLSDINDLDYQKL